MISIMSEFRMGGMGLMHDRLALQHERGVYLKREKPRRLKIRLAGIILGMFRLLAIALERVHQPAHNCN